MLENYEKSAVKSQIEEPTSLNSLILPATPNAARNRPGGAPGKM